MINVSAWSIRNPIPGVLLFIMLTAVGAMSFRAMKIQNFPDIDLPTVTVTASLPASVRDGYEARIAEIPDLPSGQTIDRLVSTLEPYRRITQPKFYGIENLPDDGSLLVGCTKELETKLAEENAADVVFLEVQRQAEEVVPEIEELADHLRQPVDQVRHRRLPQAPRPDVVRAPVGVVGNLTNSHAVFFLSQGLTSVGPTKAAQH